MSQPSFSLASRLSHRCQAVVLRSVVFGVRALGINVASNLGGWLACTVGRRLPASAVADHNLRRFMPELDAIERADIIRSVWDNLGRTSAELPYLASFERTTTGTGWEIEGEEHILALKEAGTPALFFSGHFGNWEMILPIASSLGMPVSGFYRAVSSPPVEALVQSLRRAALGPDSLMFAKGARGARLALSHLHKGGSLGFLVDQKMNDGIAVPFFGHAAMTAPALAQLSLRFGRPILPVYVVRLGGGRFRLVCEAPLVVPRSGNRVADTYAISAAVNATLERWIRTRPGAWLWLHRRWPKEA